MNMNDLVTRIERDPALTNTRDRVAALIKLIPRDQHSLALVNLAADHLRLREMARHWGDDNARAEGKAERVESRLMDLRVMNDSGVGAIEAAERAGIGSIVTLRNFLKRHDEDRLWVSLAARDPEVDHARPEVAAVQKATIDALAAKRSWTDLLSTEVTIPGTSRRVLVNNMNASELEQVARALAETHARLQVLAAAVRRAGVETPADLDPTEFAEMALGGAA